jgi:hypothetical protein
LRNPSFSIQGITEEMKELIITFSHVTIFHLKDFLDLIVVDNEDISGGCLTFKYLLPGERIA